jgi:hypothetical protein
VVAVAEELVEAVIRGQELVLVPEMVLAELSGSRKPCAFSTSAILGSFVDRPMSAPGSPTLVSPVRIGDWPVTNTARPAVQLCCPYQERNSAPSFR